MGDNDGSESLFGPLPTFPPPTSYGRRVGPIGIGIAVGLCIILLIIIICVLKRACKCKCCKRKKPTLAEKMRKKMGLEKKTKQSKQSKQSKQTKETKQTKQPFSISGILDKK